ncbi:MAG: hypothetical protein KIT31_25425, partial [Deltaproteobacteria bacterium]|nr:hypothetical protein [Deltaproteobacteria bacterium]
MDCFEDVQRLASPAVRELLERGTPPQRVWAIWTLALRTEQHDVIARIGHEPDPGVRRTLAVVLAAHREYDLLLAL